MKEIIASLMSDEDKWRVESDICREHFDNHYQPAVVINQYEAIVSQILARQTEC